jgi:hypothetical protein
LAQLAYAAAPAHLGKHEQKAAAASRPNWLMQQHQHTWANMNKKLLLLLDPTGLCSSTSTLGQTRTNSCCCFSTQLAYAAAPAQLGKHEHKAAAASRPNWLMQEHQHTWANKDKQLLLLLDPTGLCRSISAVGQTRTNSCCCFSTQLAYAGASAQVGEQANNRTSFFFFFFLTHPAYAGASARVGEHARKLLPMLLLDSPGLCRSICTGGRIYKQAYAVAVAASRPTRLMQEHQHGWVNMQGS